MSVATPGTPEHAERMKQLWRDPAYHARTTEKIRRGIERYWTPERRARRGEMSRKFNTGRKHVKRGRMAPAEDLRG